MGAQVRQNIKKSFRLIITEIQLWGVLPDHSALVDACGTPHRAHTTAVWLTGCLRDAARPSWDQNFGDLRHFETHIAIISIIDPILEPNWPAKTIKDLERVFEHFWTNKVQKHGYPHQTWGFFGFQDATTAPLFAGVPKNYLWESSRRNPWLVQNHGIQLRWTCEVQMPEGSAQVRKNLSENMWVIMNFVRTL